MLHCTRRSHSTSTPQAIAPTREVRNVNHLPRPILNLQKRSLELQKGAVDNSFNVLSRLEDHGREISQRWIEQIPNMPQEIRGVTEAIWQARINSRETWKGAIDRSFKLVDEFYDRLTESSS